MYVNNHIEGSILFLSTLPVKKYVTHFCNIWLYEKCKNYLLNILYIRKFYIFNKNKKVCNSLKPKVCINMRILNVLYTSICTHALNNRNIYENNSLFKTMFLSNNVFVITNSKSSILKILSLSPIMHWRWLDGFQVSWNSQANSKRMVIL